MPERSAELGIEVAAQLQVGPGAGKGIVLAARMFTVIDISECGRAVVDEFVAAHTAAAARRAQFAAEGVMLQLWSQGQLVGAWRRVGRRTFQPA